MLLGISNTFHWFKRTPLFSYSTHLPPDLRVRLTGGRFPQEGRVEVSTPAGAWRTVCGDGWSLLEAMVVCRSLSLGYAADAMQTTFYGGNLTETTVTGVKCLGHERALGECTHDTVGVCEGRDMAAVYCVDKMADLVSSALAQIFGRVTDRGVILCEG